MAGRGAVLALTTALMVASMRVMAEPLPVLEQAAEERIEPAIVEAVGQIARHAGQQRLIVLGELHGTREIPALTGLLLRHYAAQGPVMLALEMPQSEQPALDRYLASDGGKAAWQALASTPFWQVNDDQHDGRRSVQMRQLVEEMRVLCNQGAVVQVLAYDVTKAAADAHDHHWRDAQMAANLRKSVDGYPGTTVVLTGNVHAMRARPDWAPPELQLAPMTSQLLDLQPFAVNLTAGRGEFWGCMEERCQALPARTVMTEPLLRLREPDRVYDLVLQLPQLSLATLVETP